MDRLKKKQPPLICSEFGLVRCFGAAGIQVISGSEGEGGAELHSRYVIENVQFSSYESEKFIDELCELGKTLDYRPVLLSYDDRLIFNVSNNREKLLPYYRFLYPEQDMVENLLDKKKFIDLSNEFELPAPDSVYVSVEADLDHVSQRLRPPYLIKPLFRHYWFHCDFTKIVGRYKKAYVCNSMEQLREYYNKIAQINPNVIVQDYIKGPDTLMFDVNMYIDQKGEVRGTLVSQKIRVYPESTGYGCYVETVQDDEILSLSINFVKKLQLRGLINVQFKRDGITNEPKLIEIHPRSSIFDVLGLKAGVNLAHIYYLDMIGAEFPDYRNGKIGVKYIHLGRDIQLMLKHRHELFSTFPGLAKSYLGTKVVDGFSLMDPIPGFITLWWAVRQIVGGKAA